MALHQPVGLTHALRARELFGRPILARPQVADFCCDASEGSAGPVCGSILNDPQDTLTPAFAAEYSQVYNGSKYLGIGDEEGFLTIVNTAARLPARTADDELPGASRPAAQWEAHKNAIFDVAWTRGDAIILTASGDQSIGRFDTNTAEPVGSFRGHGGSVKSVCPMPGGAGDVFASGARDGALMVWDARLPALAEINGDPYHRPVITIQDAHAVDGERKRSRRRTPNYGRNRPSVTSVLWLQSDHTLASGGVDGVVKLWDLRQAAAPPVVAVAPGLPGSGSAHLQLQHLADAPTPALSQKQHGITCLALHPAGHQLLVSLTGGHHLLYDAKRPDAGPLRWFGGHTVSSFYVKAAFSPDGSHVLSGSSDRNAYIWQVEGADGGRPYVLPGHEGEVTAVAWCPTDFEQFATTADDATIKVWGAVRRQPEERDSPRARQRERAPLALAQARGGAPWLGASAGSLPSNTTSTTPALGGSSSGLRSPRTSARLARQSAQGQRGPLTNAPPSSAFHIQQQQQQQQQEYQDENADGNNQGGLAAAAAVAQQQQQGSGAGRLPATPAVGVASASGRSPAVTVNPLRQLQFTGRRADAATTGPRSRRTKQQTIAAFLQSPPPPASTAAHHHSSGGAGPSGARPSGAAPAAEEEAGPSSAAGGGGCAASKRGGTGGTPRAMAGSALPLQKRLRISFEHGGAQPFLQQPEAALGQQQRQQQEQAVPSSSRLANLLEPSPESMLSTKLTTAACGGGRRVAASPKASSLRRQGSVDENACGNL